MCAAWKEKNERNKIACFYCTQSGKEEQIKNISASKMKKKIKNSQPQTKFTGSYKKRVYFNDIIITIAGVDWLQKVFRFSWFFPTISTKLALREASGGIQGSCISNKFNPFQSKSNLEILHDKSNNWKNLFKNTKSFLYITSELYIALTEELDVMSCFDLNLVFFPV